MKKSINYALCYAVLGMCGGVFYREFTKFNHFEGETALSKVHAHFFMLGMVMYILIALFSRNYDLYSEKMFKAFRAIYNIGVPLTGIMLGVRGVFDVLGTELSKGADAAVSGIAGIGHILTGVGIVLLLVSLKKSADNSNKANKEKTAV